MPKTSPTNGHATDDAQVITANVTDELFNLDRLRLPQNFADSVGVRKLLKTVPVRKPSRQEFIRVHPDPAYHLDVAILELKEDREFYLCLPEIAGELSSEVAERTLYTAITRQGVTFLWPIPFPAEGRRNQWAASARDAAEEAVKGWVRVVANMNAGFYDVYAASATLPEPEWPAVSFAELLKLAFNGDKLIQSVNHPVIERLRGQR